MGALCCGVEPGNVQHSMLLGGTASAPHTCQPDPFPLPACLPALCLASPLQAAEYPGSFDAGCLGKVTTAVIKLG